MQILLAVLILPSLVLFGNPDVLRSFGKEEGIAKVGKVPITQAEFDVALRNELDKLRKQFGPQFDTRMLNTSEARQNILDGLIDRKVVDYDLAQKKLVVSNQTLQNTITQIPGVVKDKRFDKEAYIRYAASQNMTTDEFERSLKQNLATQQFLGPIRSAFMPKTVLDRLSAVNEQEREVQLLTYKPQDFTARVKITDEKLKAYYEKNAAQFEIPEQLNAEYIILSLEELAAQGSASDAEIQSFYEQNKVKYTTVPEKRRASHILIASPQTATDTDKAKAKTKAMEVLAQVRKKPEDFANLAKANSDDPGSKENGGDLGIFARGSDMVAEFEDGAFKLKQGEISELVQSEFGFHIITVTEIKPAVFKPLDEVKELVANEIKKQKASKAYAEASDTFANLLYEQSDSLKPAAEKLKLKIQTANGLTRISRSEVQSTLEISNPKFLKAIFSDDVVKKKHNTESVEIAPGVRIAGRVLEYKPTSKRSFEEVKAAILEKVTTTEAVALAEKEGQAKLTALKATDSTAGFGDIKIVSRLKNQDVPAAALVDVMRADTQKLPAFVGANLGSAGYVIVRIGKVTAGTPDPVRRASEAQQFGNMRFEQNLYAYLELLKQRAKVTINKAAIAAPVTAAP